MSCGSVVRRWLSLELAFQQEQLIKRWQLLYALHRERCFSSIVLVHHGLLAPVAEECLVVLFTLLRTQPFTVKHVLVAFVVHVFNYN